MGTSFSKRGLVEFDEYPEEYQEFYGGVRTQWGEWRVSLNQKMNESTQKEYTQVCIEGPDAVFTLEFAYQIAIIHMPDLEKNRCEPIVKKGVGSFKDGSRFYYDDPNTYSSDYLVNFQVFVYAFNDEYGIRNFGFNLGEHSWREKELSEFADRIITLFAPSLATGLDNCGLEEGQDGKFLQMVFGVRYHLEATELRSFLKASSKLNLSNIQRYFENQLIWRDDFKFSKRRLYKLAGKYQLDKLLKDLLVDVKSAKKLLDIVNSTMKIEKLNAEMSKSIVGKIFELA